MESELHPGARTLARYKCPALAFFAVLFGALALQQSHAKALKEAEIQGSPRVLAKFNIARARDERGSHVDQYLSDLERYSEQNSDLRYVGRYRAFCGKLVDSDSAGEQKGDS
jgi:hypothetical protein